MLRPLPLFHRRRTFSHSARNAGYTEPAIVQNSSSAVFRPTLSANPEGTDRRFRHCTYLSMEVSKRGCSRYSCGQPLHEFLTCTRCTEWSALPYASGPDRSAPPLFYSDLTPVTRRTKKICEPNKIIICLLSSRLKLETKPWLFKSRSHP